MPIGLKRSCRDRDRQHLCNHASDIRSSDLWLTAALLEKGPFFAAEPRAEVPCRQFALFERFPFTAPASAVGHSATRPVALGDRKYRLSAK
jgi:hypothetical protein